MDLKNPIKLRYSIADCMQSLQKANVGKLPKHSITDCLRSIEKMKNGN